MHFPGESHTVDCRIWSAARDVVFHASALPMQKMNRDVAAQSRCWPCARKLGKISAKLAQKLGRGLHLTGCQCELSSLATGAKAQGDLGRTAPRDGQSAGRRSAQARLWRHKSPAAVFPLCAMHAVITRRGDTPRDRTRLHAACGRLFKIIDTDPRMRRGTPAGGYVGKILRADAPR
eukprot:SAG31_NODE_5383_length_2572_cov_5.701981_2_plen_177_part_00